eukprot:UN12212
MQVRNFLLQFVLGQAPKSAKMSGLKAATICIALEYNIVP